MRGVPAQRERCLVCSPVAVQGELTLGSSNDLSLVKDLIAGDHQHAAVIKQRWNMFPLHVVVYLFLRDLQ